MKKLSKNKMAKLLATFLGASTILTPMVTLISCEQPTKTPIVKEKQQEKPQPGTGPTEPGTGPTEPGTEPTEPETEPTEPETEPQPEQNTQTVGNATIVTVKDKSGNTTITATGNITLDEIEELAKKSTNDVVINTDALTIKSFKTENNENKILTISKDKLKEIATKLSILKIENLDETKQNITLDKNADIKTISGNISLIDIMESDNTSPETEITKYIANNLKEKKDKDFDSSKLTINTFCKKDKTRGNISSRNATTTNSNSEYISTPITPTFLKETKLNALNKAILNFKDNENNIHVVFASRQGQTKEEKQKDYFDITEFYNEIENGKLKNIPTDNVKGDIFLRGEREPKIDDKNGEDYTNYPNTEELVSLIKKFNNNKVITVGSVYIAGTLNELLPYLIKIDGKTQIEENYKDIKIVNYYNTKCYETGYKNGKLPADQLQEYYNRAKNNAMRITDATIENLDSTNYTGDFVGDMLTRVNFKDSNLSNISFYSCMTSNGYLKFENSTLPANMSGSNIKDIILKNVTFPKEEFSNNSEEEFNDNSKYNFSDLPYNLPNIEGSLEIYGEIKNSILDGATSEQLNSLVPQKNMPPEYKGPQEIYNRLKKIFNGESQIINGKPNPNYQGSIQKIKDQYLALIQNQGKSRG